jgi:hypothetical protein
MDRESIGRIPGFYAESSLVNRSNPAFIVPARRRRRCDDRECYTDCMDECLEISPRSGFGDNWLSHCKSKCWDECC